MAIQAGDATAESVDDLRDANRKELRTVRIITSTPEVVVAFGDSPVVRTTEQDQAAIDLVDAVSEMLKPRMSFGARNRRLVQIGTATVTLGGLAGNVALLSIFNSPALLMLPYLVLLAAIALMNKLIDGRADIVPLLPREAREERLKRNHLIAAGVLSFLGGAGVAALTFYLGWQG
ncbi:hypothetical protein [Streptomyces sp. NPDC020951]|uniref:hypothetical protein n=1 Tax=Streptomyces sp. NPDC020951 TaxID=3365104 RepID=UPI0037AE1956